ncbi:ribonucleoside-diphosphate reductase subunit alpha [Candidatus Saccharibacteria bacterium]|nr:ribonucleoside-diphosphate reductase subunit alpha [Candidatus Saccharibacteria bacterium]MBQ69857.1 ribonucleoside-diphosphate reductase subunit alpha [Candidatus Saccharibacteria bacterium]
MKRDGTREPFDANKINLALVEASEGLPDQISKVVQVASELQLTLFDGITSEQLDEAVIHTALQNVKDDPDFDTVAARLLLKNIYKNVLGDYNGEKELKSLHAKKFPQYLKENIEAGLLDERMTDKTFDIKKLSAALDPSRDRLMRYLGVVTSKNRYSLRKNSGQSIEVPQFTAMRIAMGLSLLEENPTEVALEFYEYISKLDANPAGSTRINAGGSFPQLSNCFLFDIEDDMDAIARAVRDTMWIAKGTGGIGIGVTKLRAAGSPVRTTNTESTGPIPFIKMIDTALFAVSRKGKKQGAAAIFMENWHYNFPEFLDLKQNSGDPYLRTRIANTAVALSDEFMKRVESDQDWYMFDPAETPDLVELYGSAFSKRYQEYVELAEAGKLRDYRKVPAKQQFRQILTTLQATSHPWLTWKDTMNVRALNNNTGTIHHSNLCTEITLPQDKDNTAVCNLSSINLSVHLKEDKTWDWDRLERAVRVSIRQLDNLCSLTNTPIPQAMNSNLQNRAVGLGVMGFTDVLEKLGYAYDSDEAYELMDELLEFISYHSIDASADLAKERGSYPNYKGSGWSKGQLPIDTIDILEKDRKVKVDISRKTRLDWEKLRAKVKKGMRNATLMAIAPTANNAHVSGTTPGIDPQFAQIFSRATLNGKFLEVNTNLVRDLKELGIWEQVKDDILRNQGDVQQIDAIPQHLKNVYKTSFQLSPYAFIEVAARAQKWVDQAISRNMYLETRNIDDMVDIYSAAWRQGLKTTYYLHMKPRHTAEQSTVKVNKAEASGGPRKTGFGFARKQGVAA